MSSSRRNVVVDALEPRRLLTDAGFGLNNLGEFKINATDGDDVVAIGVHLTKFRVVLNGDTHEFTRSSIKSISIDLGDGSDRLDIGGGVGPIYCLGGLGNDTINGGAGNDTITAGGGRDSVTGGAGDDRLDGGPTADTVIGGDGADRIYGSDANDYLEGDAGVDRLFGGLGNDSLVGGSSNDKLYGDDGDDTLAGGNQNDSLTGGAGNDVVFGNDGFDTLDGQSGDDSLIGGANDDSLIGDTGIDSLDGGAGNDTLAGGAQGDSLFGSDGNDSLDGGDQPDTLRGGNGNDTLLGGSSNDDLFGGDGADVMNGNGGADHMYQRNDAATVVNRTGDDAVLKFVDQDVVWSDAEIEQLDVGLTWLANRTNNTKLLKRFDGKDVAILRVADLGENILADNIGDGRIRFADLAFEDSSPPDVTVVHEMGHNWDEVTENPGIKAFFDLSAWRHTSAGWTYKNLDAVFASDYGRTNPYEDFATSFEVYYSKEKPASQWQAKWDYMNDFYNNMTT